MSLRRIRNNIRQFFIRKNLRKSGTFVHYSAFIHPKAIIGQNCKIGKDCIVRSNVIIEDDIKIGSYSELENIHIGKHSNIEQGVIIAGTGKGKIKIGTNCYIGINNVLDTSANITIGDFVHIAGPSTGLWTHSSALMCINGIALDNKNEEVRPTGNIIINSNTYIGGNCTIYPNVNISSKCIIAPNSVVNKDLVEPGLYGGVPVKFIKK